MWNGSHTEINHMAHGETLCTTRDCSVLFQWQNNYLEIRERKTVCNGKIWLKKYLLRMRKKVVAKKCAVTFFFHDCFATRNIRKKYDGMICLRARWRRRRWWWWCVEINVLCVNEWMNQSMNARRTQSQHLIALTAAMLCYELQQLMNFPFWSQVTHSPQHMCAFRVFYAFAFSYG